MKKEIFVEQPNINVKMGVKVNENTEFKYSNNNVKQELRGLVLKTECKEAGTNGINLYESKSHITIYLNEGDILLFDENRGYYMPPYPMETIEDAISDIESLRGITLDANKSEGD